MIARPLWFALAALFAGACGGVTPIDVHDERVPLEARQWVGGADDAVAIARANLDDARAELAEIEGWKKTVTKAVPAGLKSPLGDLVAARLSLAERHVAAAEAGLELARASRTLVHAETAMRYDLAVYELDPLRDKVAAARAENERRSRAVEEATVAREKTDAAFWTAYRAAYPQDPDVARLFWLSR